METVFSKAADIIRERGWCQNMSRDAEGRVCLGQALFDAGMRWSERSALSPVGKLVLDALGPSRNVPRWNDDDHRTEEDVLLFLKHLHIQAGGS